MEVASQNSFLLVLQVNFFLVESTLLETSSLSFIWKKTNQKSFGGFEN